MDAWTAHLSLPVRPEEQRHGSIVLLGGWTAANGTRTIVYEPFPDNPSLHHDLRWDGADPYSSGYRWTRRDADATPDDEYYLGDAFDRLEQDGGLCALAGVMRCRMGFLLYEGGVLQDTKTVLFRAVE